MYNYLLVTKNIHIFARVSQFEIRDFSRFSVFEVYFNAILHIYNLLIVALKGYRSYHTNGYRFFHLQMVS